MAGRTIVRLVDGAAGPRWALPSRVRSQLLRSAQLLARLASALPPNSAEATSAKNAAAWSRRLVELSMGSVSPETTDRKTMALPKGDRT